MSEDILKSRREEHRSALEDARKSIEEAKSRLAEDLAAMHRRKLDDCVLFSYSHGFITEGCGMSLLGVDRLEFRDRWIAFLRANPAIAKETGWDDLIDSRPTEVEP